MAQLPQSITISLDPFFTDTRIQICTATDCMYNQIHRLRDAGLACTLKEVNVGENGICSKYRRKEK